jgi:hypothetical protein
LAAFDSDEADADEDDANVDDGVVADDEILGGDGALSTMSIAAISVSGSSTDVHVQGSCILDSWVSSTTSFECQLFFVQVSECF